MLKSLAESVLPEIDSSDSHFGTLNFEKVKKALFLLELISTNPRKLVKNNSTPIFCFYGTQDTLLGLEKKQKRFDYEENFKTQFNNIKFFKSDADHFYSGQLETLNNQIIRLSGHD